jgi:D-amino-acid dehydrogenase
MNKKIIIVGGGIAGASAAYFLSKQGADVTLIDRKDKGQATDAGAGIICPWLSLRRNKAWYRLVTSAARMYPKLIKELEADGERDTGYKRVGALKVHRDKHVLEEMKERTLKRREDAPEIGEVNVLDEIQTRELFPLLREDYQALYVSGAARVDGRKLRNALTRAAEKHGATLIKGNGALLTEGRRVTGVKVQSEEIYADHVIATTGAWMNELLEPLGVKEFSVRPQKAHILHVRYDPLEENDLPVVMFPRDQYILGFEENRFVIGSTKENDAGFNADITAFGVHEILSKAFENAPALRDSTILEARVGFRPMTDQSLPIMGRLKSLDDLLYANGLGATGLTAGPFVGQQLAKLALNEPLDITLDDYQI